MFKLPLHVFGVIFCATLQLNSLGFDKKDSGILFEKKLNWEGIKAKAKAENKLIFVDFVASWCKPCKTMEEKVYNLESIGKIVNSKFVSVKIQMDKLPNDGEWQRQWYDISAEFQKEFNITAYPSFVFFSPDGVPVHKSVGYKNTKEFVTLISKAIDSSKQYYTLLKKYEMGQRDYTNAVPYLAQTAKMLGEDTIASRIADDYIKNYLNKVKADYLFTAENIDFLGAFLNSSKGLGFDLFYRCPRRIDSIMNKKGYAQDMVDYIITKEEVDSKIWENGKPAIKRPNWNKINKQISRKYNSMYAHRVCLYAKLRWYDFKKDWPNLVKYHIERVEKYGLDTAGIGMAFFNNMIYEVIFKHSDDKQSLTKAINWMKIVITASPTANHFDTYANVLYKAGLNKEALYWEEKALMLEQKSAIEENRDPDKVFQQTLEKMRKGIPTWDVPTSNDGNP